MPLGARLNNGQELLEFLTSIKKYYIPASGIVTDTTSADAAAADANLTMTTFASWTTDDHLIIKGSGGMERNQFGTKPGSAAPIPLKRKLQLAQLAGAVVTKATEVDLGHIEDAGGTIAASKTKSAVGAANSRSAIAYIDGDYAEPTFSFSVRGSHLRDILSAWGIHEDSVQGAGTSTDPYRAFVGRSNIGTQANYCLLASGLYIDGRTVNFDFWNCFPEISLSAQIVGKGQPTVWGISVKYTDMLIWLS